MIKDLKNKWLMLNNPELPTFPSKDPKKCIDFIFAAKSTVYAFQTKQTIVEQEPVASDHLPVWVEVEIK